MKKIALLGGMFMMALASVGCGAGVDEGGENVGSNKEGIGQGSTASEKPVGDSASRDANAPTSEAAFAGPFWIYGQPFSGTVGVLPPGCEIVENGQRGDDFGEGVPATIIGVTVSAYEIPENTWPWLHEIRYHLNQQETQNAATWMLDIAACADGASVQLEHWATWYVANYQP
jgi:hypothetical protein